MNISKGIWLFVLSLALFSLTSCKWFIDFDSKEVGNTNGIDSGICVNGEGSYRWVQGGEEYDSILYIKSNDVSISGTTENNVLICVTENVTQVNLDDLDQGSGRIDIHMSVKENWTVDLNFKGENTINCIKGCENLNVIGNSNEDELLIAEDIVSYADIKFYNGRVVAKYIEAWGDLNIIGSPQVQVICNDKNKNGDKYITGVSIDKELNIELTEGGSFSVIFYTNKSAIIAAKGININNNTELYKPKGGFIDISDYEFNDEYVVYNSDGTFADEVVIKYKE